MDLFPSQVLGAVGLLLWLFLCVRAGIWTRKQSQLRDIIETIAHGVALGFLTVLMLGWLPKQPAGAASKDQTNHCDQRTGDRSLVGISVDLVIPDQPGPVRVIDPLAQTDEKAGNSAKNQRLAQVWVIAESSGTDHQRRRKNREGAIPLVSAQPFDFIHEYTPLEPLTQLSAKAGA